MEVLITCDESTTNGINFYHPISGTKLLSLRAPPVNPSSLSFIKNEGFLVTESGKPFIHFWQSGSIQSSKRILCSSKPGPCTLCPNGAFLIVAIEEKINVWQIATGKIVAVLTAHYRPVNVLKFSTDGKYLLSAGQDGLVLVFKFLSLVSKASLTPLHSWTDHSFPVTDLHVGIGSQPTVFSVSLDRTAKIYSLLTGSLILSVSFPLPLTTVVADAAEFAFYVGTSAGIIYQMKLNAPPRSIEHHVSDVSADQVFKKHSNPITALCISSDGRLLASADQVGNIYIWDIKSCQPIKTIGSEASGNSRVTNLSFWLGDPENLKGSQKSTIIFPEVPRLIETVEDNDQVMVWNRIENEDFNSFDKAEEISTVEISNVKRQLAEAEDINKKLHQFFVENILG